MINKNNIIKTIVIITAITVSIFMAARIIIELCINNIYFNYENINVDNMIIAAIIPLAAAALILLSTFFTNYSHAKNHADNNNDNYKDKKRIKFILLITGLMIVLIITIFLAVYYNDGSFYVILNSGVLGSLCILALNGTAESYWHRIFIYSLGVIPVIFMLVNVFDENTPKISALCVMVAFLTGLVVTVSYGKDKKVKIIAVVISAVFLAAGLLLFTNLIPLVESFFTAGQSNPYGVGWRTDTLYYAFGNSKFIGTACNSYGDNVSLLFMDNNDYSNILILVMEYGWIIMIPLVVASIALISVLVKLSRLTKDFYNRRYIYMITAYFFFRIFTSYAGCFIAGRNANLPFCGNILTNIVDSIIITMAIVLVIVEKKRNSENSHIEESGGAGTYEY